MFRSGVRGELAGLRRVVEIVGEAGDVDQAVAVIDAPRPTSCCSTSTCPAAAASR